MYKSGKPNRIIFWGNCMIGTSNWEFRIRTGGGKFGKCPKLHAPPNNT